MATDAQVNLYLKLLDDATVEISRLKAQLAGAGTAARKSRDDTKALQGQLRELDGVLGAFGGAIGGPLGQMGGLLGGLIAGPVGIAALGGLAIKTALDLGKMGEESLQLDARFRAFAGGAQQAEANLRAMDAAVGLSLTNDDQMIALNALMASGLTRTAAEAASVAQAALWLGAATQAPLQRIEALTQALLSGRERGLIPYGVNLDLLKTRVDALKQANAGLSDSQATLQAFMEQAAGLMQKVEAEGGAATTSMQELSNAWANLKDVLGAKIAPEISITVRWGAKILNDLTEFQEMFRFLPVGTQIPVTVGAAIGASMRADAEKAGQMERAGAAFLAQKQAQADLNAATASGDEVAIQAALANLRLAGALALATAAAEKGTPLIWDAVGAYDALTRAADRAVKPVIGLAQPGHGGMPARPDWGPDAMLKLDQGADRALRSALADRYKWQAEQNDKLAQQAAKGFESAFTAATNRVSSLIGSGMSASQKLLQGWLPGAGNPMEDPNGPFRDVRRALDVAKLGEASPWFKDLGISVEQAQKVAGDVNKGLFTKDVEALVDKDMLAGLIAAEEASEANMRRFAASLDGLVGSVEAAIKRLAGVGATPGAAGAAKTGAPATVNNTAVYAPTYVQNAAALAGAQRAYTSSRVSRLAEAF